MTKRLSEVEYIIRKAKRSKNEEYLTDLITVCGAIYRKEIAPVDDPKLTLKEYKQIFLVAFKRLIAIGPKQSRQYKEKS